MLSCFPHIIGPNYPPLRLSGHFAGPQGSCDSSNMMPAGMTHAHPNAWRPTHPSGLTFLTGCSLALGPFAAGDPSHAWQHADAILNCGSTEHQRLTGQEKCASTGMGLRNGMCKASERISSTISPASPASNQPFYVCSREVTNTGCAAFNSIAAPDSRPASDQQQHGRRIIQESQSNSECCRNSPGGICDAQSACSQQQQQHDDLSAYNCNDRCNGSNQAATGAWPAYLYLPVRSAKVDRQGLLRVLPTAMEFAAHHLCQGRSVLIHDDRGTFLVFCLLSGSHFFAPFARPSLSW